MRAVVQRVTRAEVRVAGQAVGRIAAGMAVLVGISRDDTMDSVRYLAEKLVNLRIFPEAPDDSLGSPDVNVERKNLDRSLLDIGGSILCVSQFTLYGDCRKGRRPSFDRAAPPAGARPLYQALVEALRDLMKSSSGKVESGEFQAMMEVELVNDGPVTLLLDTEKLI